MTAWTGSLWRPGLPPGVYERRPAASAQGAVRLDTAVFVGLCERGPLGAPVVLESWEAFRQVFGRPGLGRLLPDSVRLFFENGGRRCAVLRCLHADAKAARWELPLPLSSGGVPVSVYARTPGAWGNGLTGSMTLASRFAGVEPEPPGIPPAAWDGQTLRARGNASLDPTRGSVLRFEAPSPHPPLLRTVVSADRNPDGSPRLALDSPLPSAYRDADAVRRAREILVDLEWAVAGYAERFTGLGLDSAHPRFLPRALALPSPHESLARPAEARSGGWPIGDADAAYAVAGEGAEDAAEPVAAFVGPESAFAGSALVAPAAALLTSHLDVDPLAPLDRRLPLAAAPARPATEAGDTFRRRDFAVTRAALDFYEERHPFEPLALICLPDLMHPESRAPEILTDANPASPTRFGPCSPPPDETFATAVPYPGLGLQDGVADVFETQRDWMDWCAAHREHGGVACLLLDAPPEADAQGLLEGRRRLAADFAALYTPWLLAPATEGVEAGGAAVNSEASTSASRLLLLPPSPLAAAAAGLAEREIGPHGAPAHRPVHGVAGLFESGRLPGPGYLHEERINAFRATETGFRLLGARTTSLDSEWTHLNVRRLMDWLRRQLSLDARWAVFEPHGEELRARLRQAVERRLRQLFERGALAGKAPEEAYFVRARGDRADYGEVIVEVGVAPSVPMEFIVFELSPPAPEATPREALLA